MIQLQVCSCGAPQAWRRRLARSVSGARSASQTTCWRREPQTFRHQEYSRAWSGFADQHEEGDCVQVELSAGSSAATCSARILRSSLLHERKLLSVSFPGSNPRAFTAAIPRFPLRVLLGRILKHSCTLSSGLQYQIQSSHSGQRSS